LAAFIKEQQAEQRAVRALEREQSDRDKALEIEKMKIDLEQQKLAQETKNKQMEMELGKLRID